MNGIMKNLRKVLLTLGLALGIGAIIILCIGENPIDAYIALFNGAFSSKRAFGTTLASFTPLLLQKQVRLMSEWKEKFSWEELWLLTSESTGRFFQSHFCLWYVFWGQLLSGQHGHIFQEC